MAEINLDSSDGLTGDVETNQVDIDMEHQVKLPQIWQTFTDLEEMFLYYKDYAKRTGFPVLQRSSKKGENDELKYVTFTYAQTGNFKSKSSNSLKPRPSTKTGCRARLSGCLDDDGKWRVSSLNLGHNHSLSPSKSRFSRFLRKISASVKRCIEIKDTAGVRLNKSFNTFVVEAGGHENISFLEKDCRNYIEKVRRLQLGKGDAMALQDYSENAS